jgi:hypothetical protein
VWLIVAVRCGCLNFVMRIARAAVDLLRLTFARERLDSAPAPAAQERKSPGVVHVLFVSREPLAVEPEAPRASRSLLRVLFAPERLPLDPEPAPAARRKGRLAALFAAEQLGDPPDDVP